jgi:CCR4-NOT transcription complex subunit 4
MDNCCTSQRLTDDYTVDEEFPPLGKEPKDKHASPFQTHFPQEPQDLSLGSGTPTLPPGLPLPHGHPVAALLHSPLKPSSPGSVASPPVQETSAAPAKGSIQIRQENIYWRQTPDKQITPSHGPRQERLIGLGDVSLGSPKMKPSKTNHDRAKGISLSGGKDPSVVLAEAPQRVNRQSSKKLKPIKLSLPLTPGPSQDVTLSRDRTQSQTAPLTGVFSQIGSRPNTPLTGISRASDSSSTRLPRVLRVADTPKVETPPSASAVLSVSSVLASKAPSRRASISSSRPVTPGELGSDYEPNTSASVSRANSPPPSRVGSAPLRTMTKSQAKKERKLKAKQVEAKKDEPVTTVSIEEPVQAPIIGRKRKTKKPPVGATEQSEMNPASASEQDKPLSNAEYRTVTKSDQKPDAANRARSSDTGAKEGGNAPVDGKDPNREKANAETWRSNNTLEQLIKDAQVTGTSIKELFLERTSPLQIILAQLHKSDALDLNTHPLFNPPNLNQRFDMKCSSEDYDKLKHPIELNEEHRKKLLQGEPIHINHDSNLQKNRCLVTPRGCILHHLSPGEEGRYLTLEKSMAMIMDSIQEYPTLSITDPDLTNRGGGLDALFATPEKFNIRWVDERPQTGLTSGSSNTAMASGTDSSAFSNTSTQPNALSAMDADTTRNHNWPITNTAELLNSTASVRSFATATAKHMLGASSVAISEDMPDLEGVLGMSDEELRSFIDRSQRELENSRKEFEAVDKRLATLVKRNKKLAYQALTTTVDTGTSPS